MDVGMIAGMDGAKGGWSRRWTRGQTCEWTDRRVDGGIGGRWHAQRDTRMQAQTHRGTGTWTQTHGGERKEKEGEIRAGVAEMHLHPNGPQCRRTKRIRMEKGEEEEQVRRMKKDERWRRIEGRG